MLHTGFADPSQQKLLTAALQDYCQSNGIEEGTLEYDETAELVIVLFKRGLSTADETKGALARSRPAA